VQTLYKKAVHKMLMKLTPSVNFIIILQADFVPIFLPQKITKPNCKKRKTAQNSFVWKSQNKMLCWWNWHLHDRLKMKDWRSESFLRKSFHLLNVKVIHAHKYSHSNIDVFWEQLLCLLEVISSQNPYSFSPILVFLNRRVATHKRVVKRVAGSVSVLNNWIHWKWPNILKNIFFLIKYNKISTNRYIKMSILLLFV